MRRALLATALLLAACGGGDDEATSTTTTAGATTGTSAAPGTASPDGPDLDAVALRLTEVGRFEQPVAMTWCGEEAYVAEKGGRVRRFDGGDVVLDLSSAVSDGGEQGLLGIACGPGGDRFYASYTDTSGDSRVDELPITASGTVDRDGGRTLLELDQPAANHNGGNIVFGPDGKLWLGLGDGGGGNDQFDNAQDPDELLGSMVRIDPAGGEPEIVLKGLRNPWRFSFDRETGDLWIGDVGQGDREEITRLPAGEIDGRNLGWPAFEGTRRHRDDVAAPAGAVPPVFEYGRDDGQAVVGGHVYRGDAIPALQGAYLFTDTYTAVLRVLAGDRTRDLGEIPGGLVPSFAEAPDGELYVLSLEGGIHRIEAA